MAKKRINYVKGEIPDNIADILANADEQDLKILTLLLMAADKDGEVEDGFSAEQYLGISKADVDASLKFWRGAGVVASARTQKKKNEDGGTVSVNTAHRNGAVESGGVENYQSAELATLLESRAVSACFVDEAQKVFGKTFNSYDTSVIVGLVDQYGFEEEAILEILAYVFRMGKKGVKYAEKVAIGFYDDGLTTAADVTARIALIERSREESYKIKKIFGFGDRALTKTEQALFEKWVGVYGYDVDVIKLAYDMMIDAIQKPVPKYADKILERWHCEGLRALSDVEAYEKSRKDGSSQGGADKNDPQKSYEVDDFFEAAMKRSFKDLK